MAPKKTQLTPIAIGLGLLGLFLLLRDQGAAPTPAPTPTPSGGGGAPVDHVMQTSGGLLDTAHAQQMLVVLGRAAGDAAMSSLVVDGAWGNATATAVQHYQAIKGLPLTGQIDPQTAQAIAADYQKLGAAAQ